MHEFSAGRDQLFVTYASERGTEEASSERFVSRVAADAERRAAEGWRVIATSVFTSRRHDGQEGSAGGGTNQLATQLSATVVYSRLVA